MGVDVIIVSYRSRALVRSCLDSLREFEPVGGPRIFVVDNASGDGTVEVTRAEFPTVEVIANDHNAGFGASTTRRSGRFQRSPARSVIFSESVAAPTRRAHSRSTARLT